ncbi:MAG: YicC family protein [Pseudomonadales bacterium]|nr:YicC family protein [Pseudomonadales bacterium]
MLSSMTAFARVESDSPWGRISWEIRSVNHRYLDLSFRMPEEFRSLEHELRDLARKQLDRGKVECTMRVQALDQSDQPPQINTATLEGLQKVEVQLLELMPNAASLSVKELLAWPGVFSEADVDPARQQKVITKLFKQALSSLKENRAREGADLYEVINSRLERMREEVVKVSKILPDVLEAQRQRLKDRLQELDIELDPGRIEQEVVLVAQKMDVDEELDRLRAHIGEVQRIIDGSGVAGRRLDFMMQELNREANTLSSKSIAHDTTRSAVELKVLIEQVREQIQNIE